MILETLFEWNFIIENIHKLGNMQKNVSKWITEEVEIYEKSNGCKNMTYQTESGKLQPVWPEDNSSGSSKIL